MKVLLTGGKGMLGRTICRVLGDKFEIMPTDLPEADITDEECIDRAIAVGKGIILAGGAGTKGWINDAQLKKLADGYGQSSYGPYLMDKKM